VPKKEDSANGKVNKSQAIRDVLAGNPKADSKTVIAQLGEKGIKVSPAMVYYIKSKARHARRRAKRDRVSAMSATSVSRNPVELVKRVKDLAREVGGYKQLKQLVDLLAE